MQLIGTKFTVTAGARKAKDDHPVYAKVFNGKVWAVTSADFSDGDQLDTGKLRSRLNSAARHRGKRLESRVRDDGKTLEIRAVPRDQPLRRAG